MRAFRALALLAAVSGCALHVNNPEIASRNQLDVRTNAAVQGAGTVIVAPDPSSASAPANLSPSQAPPQMGAASSMPTPEVSSEPQVMVSTNPMEVLPSESHEIPTPMPLATPASPVTTSPTLEPSPSIDLHTPAPSPIASTIPTQVVTPTPTPDPRYRPPTFITVKSVAIRSPVEVIDFGTVVVANGTTLSITTNAGESWSDHALLRPLKAMSWIDAAHGWAITDQYAIWRLTVTDGRLDVEVLDPIRGGSPFQVHFVDSQRGYITTSANNGTVMSTGDGGRTWGNGIAVGEVNTAAKFFGRGERFCYVNGWEQLYMKQPGGFARVQLPNNTAVGQVAFADGVAAVRYGNAIAVSTDDVAYTAINRDLRTSTQVLSGWLSQVFPISRDVWIGQGPYHLALTRDGGQTWLEPSSERHTFKWLKPFSESQMWGATDDTMSLTLYRAGRL